MRFWKRSETELEREIAHHLHHLAAEYERQGHPRSDALRMARREFGGAEQFKEQCRDERRFAWLTGLRQDFTFGLRMMRGAPAITAAVVLSLALGIGANAAIASLMDVILWRNLDVPSPQQLRLVVWEGTGSRELFDGASGSMYPDGAGHVADFFSYPAYQTMRSALQGRASLAAYSDPLPVSVSFSQLPSIAQERPVSGNFFSTLQLKPHLGRLLVEDDDRRGASATAVLTHRYWNRVLGADPNVLGKTLVVNQKPQIVVGILDPSFSGLFPGDPTEIYTTLHHAPALRGWSAASWLADNTFWGTQIIMRLDPGADPRQVRDQMHAVFSSTWAAQPKDPAAVPRLRLDDGARGLGVLSRNFRSPLLVLGGLVCLLLVIACLNIANLLLARAVARRKEIAMRVSLGCSRARLIRQFVIESALLAALGGAASIAVAYATANLLGQFVGGRESLPIAFTLDYRIVSFVGVTTAAALAVFAALPAWQGSRRLDATWLKQSAGSIGSAQGRKWTSGRVLVVAQMAMSVVLVMAAVIFTRNLHAIQTTDPGFDRSHLALFGVRPGASGYEGPRLRQFYFDLEQRLAATPGVERAGIAFRRPMNLGGWWEKVRLAGEPEGHRVSMNGVTPSYLPLYSPRLVAGRNITWADVDTGAKVAVISEDFARRLGGPGVLGKTLYFTGGGATPVGHEIVGIAPAIAVTSMKERPFAMWTPLKLETEEVVVVVRTAHAAAGVLPAIRGAMSQMDRNLPMMDVVTMDEQIGKGLQRERMFATLCGGFGVLAIALAVVGLYGVMAYSTSRRRGEIGVRLALGAVPRDVLSMVMREGLALAVAGIGLGLPVVWLGAKYAERELFQMKVFEPVSIVAALIILLTAALVAVGLPASRASRLQPSDTLRDQ